MVFKVKINAFDYKKPEKYQTNVFVEKFLILFIMSFIDQHH